MARKAKQKQPGDIVIVSGPARRGRFAGAWLVVSFLLVFGTLGSILLYASHADSTQVPCQKVTGQYKCSFASGPVRNSDDKKIGTISSGVNTVICQQQGGRAYNANAYDNWWAWMRSDQNTSGWVSVTLAKGGADNGSLQLVPNCDNAHGLAPLAPPINPHDCVGLANGQRCNGTGATCDPGYVTTDDQQSCEAIPAAQRSSAH